MEADDVLKRLKAMKEKLQTGPTLDMYGNLIPPKGSRSSGGSVDVSKEDRDFYTLSPQEMDLLKNKILQTNKD